MRTRRGAVLLGVVLGAMAVAQVLLAGGCGQFGVADDSSDAAATGTDAATAIALDASLADTLADPDATATPAPDGSCGAHAFCADFESAPPEQGWTTQHLMTGVLGIVAGGRPGSALSSSIPAADAPTSYAYLAREFKGAKGLHLEVEMRFPHATFQPDAVITLIQLSGNTSGGSGSGVGFVLSTAQQATPSVGFYVAHGDGTDETIDAKLDLPRDQWLHVVFELRFGSGGHVMVKVGSITAIDRTIDTVPPAVPELRIGVQHYNGPTPDLSVLYDTLRADPLP